DFKYKASSSGVWSGKDVSRRCCSHTARVMSAARRGRSTKSLLFFTTGHRRPGSATKTRKHETEPLSISCFRAFVADRLSRFSLEIPSRKNEHRRREQHCDVRHRVSDRHGH